MDVPGIYTGDEFDMITTDKNIYIILSLIVDQVEKNRSVSVEKNTGMPGALRTELVRLDTCRYSGTRYFVYR